MLDTQLTTAEAAAVGGVLGAMFGMIVLLFIVFYILMVIADWKIFVKAGEPGWKSLIPIYNVYIMFKIVNMQTWFWYLITVNVIASIMFVIDGYNPYAIDTSAQSFNYAEHPMTTVTLAFTGIVELIASIIYVYRTVKVFGKGNGFAIGLFFLPNIFWLILAFGKAKYNKKNLKK